MLKIFRYKNEAMNYLKPGILLLLAFYSCLSPTLAQEKLFPLYENTALQQMNQPAHKVPKSFNKTQTVLQLPFFDDFSKYTGYPNDSLWMDNEVYINTGYPVNPPSTGVATFDGLNSYGLAYDLGNNDNGVPTDTLTSTYIDLSHFTAGDSVYLSFFYQPGGVGETPDPSDSLMVEFKPDSVPIAFDTLGNITKWSDTVWVKVWTVPGASVYPFQVAMIPINAIRDTTGHDIRGGINDTNYFQRKFQFRFRAYGNQSGNLDIWNVDYVYLNNNRTLYDTAFPDVTVYQPSKSLINGYYSIPWSYYKSYTSQYYTDSIHIFTHNNDVPNSAPRHVTFSYNIQSLPDGTLLASRSSTQVANVYGQEYLDFSLPADTLKPSFVPKNPDSVVLSVQTIAEPNVPDYYLFIPNDTATNLQVFNTYLAYDDGTAEQGYGITNTNTSDPSSQVALKFNIPGTDTLFGIGIHFNQSISDVTNNEVSLMAWSSVDTTNSTLMSDTDKVIAELDNIKPEYTFRRNGFYYFPLDTPRVVSKTFYLGWWQTSDFLLNVGFDMDYHLDNFNTESNLWYNVNGGWYKSVQPGVPMIRAYVGKKPVDVAAINNIANKGSFYVDVYPNPSQGKLNVSLPENGKFNMDFIDINGKVLSSNTNLSGDLSVNTGSYQPGVYIIKIIDPATGSRVYKKVVLE